MDFQLISHSASLRAAALSILIALCGIPSLAIAQVQSGPVEIAPGELVATNLPDVKAYPRPPAAFNPLTAPAKVLVHHGFPPMPDPQKAPDAYAVWRKAVTAPQKRLENPSLVKIPIFHRPAKIVYGNKSQESERANIAEKTGNANISNTISAYSYNWSGYAIYDPANPFKKSLVYSYWNVPTAQQAFGQCNGTWDFCAQWVGIDGVGSNDVLQAGTEADAYCGVDGQMPYYAAWIEWYPGFESVISNFNVRAGDVVFVEVWDTSATQGNAYFVDFTAPGIRCTQL